MKVRPTRGFTLIELIVVIGILTLLIGILVPYLSGARRQAKGNVCLSQLKGIGSAILVYLSENKDQFPPDRLSKVPASSSTKFVHELGAQEPRWPWFLYKSTEPVLDTNKYPRVAGKIRSDGFFTDDLKISSTKITNQVYICPVFDDDRYADDIRHGSYGYNYQYLGNARQDTDAARWDNFSVGLHKLKSPSNTVVVADSRGGDVSHGPLSYRLDPPRLAIEQNAKRMGPDEGELLPEETVRIALPFSPVETRHNEQGNIIFADGHGQSMKLGELGYQLDEKGVAVPILDPADGTKWHNRLWTGLGGDKMAEQRFGSGGP